ncbi:MAG: diaminopimelate decarboxylase [Candidatus Aenigmatarchaeota archaeon]
MNFDNGNFLFEDVGFREFVDEFETPLYVYEKSKIVERFSEVAEAVIYEPKKLLYACKANANPHIMKVLKEAGCHGIDVASPGEIEFSKLAGFNSKEMFFTSNSASQKDLEIVGAENINFNADSLEQIETYASLEERLNGISVRINPGIGAGHHEYVITGDEKSKFGIPYTQVNEIIQTAKDCELEIVGLHMHIGSRFLTSEPFLKASKSLLRTAENFPDLEYVNFGGGVGIPYGPNENEIDLNNFGVGLSEIFEQWCENYGRDLDLILENGRYYVADSGSLLTMVTDRKLTPCYTFIGTDTGFNHLIRPVLYGAYHEIVNLSNPYGEKEEVLITGNVCESGDVFTRDKNGIKEREIPKPRKDDILAILNAGAYGFSMSSNYNSRLRPAEVLIDKEKSTLIRRRETYKDIARTIT